MAIATQHIPLLVVDDDELEVVAIRRGLKKINLNIPFCHAKDGLEALDFLRGKHGHDKLGKPFLVLLDINMPRMNGHEFMREVRADPELCDTVIFVLTTSNDESDMTEAYQNQAAGFIVKSHLKGDYQSLAMMLKTYWDVVLLPN